MGYSIPDHPVIRRMERSGYPSGKEPKFPRCPICDEETDTFYKDKCGDIAGCDNCICTCDAWDETMDNHEH